MGAALLTAVLIASYTLCDGLGVRRAASPTGYMGWLFLLTGLPWVAVLAHVRRRRPERLHRRAVLPGLVGGAFAMTAYSLVIWALSLAPMAPVAALRETSVIFAALIGTLALGEPFGRRRVLAACLVAAGTVLVHV